MDDVTFQVLTAVLTIVGAAVTVLVWRRRGPASGLRAAAVTLLPLAALLTGTMRLLWQVGDAVASWAVRLVFSPLVWLGISLAGVSLVLFVVSGFLRGRGVGAAPRPHTPEAEDRTGERALGPRQAPPADDDLDDVEAILRKHGIS